MCSTLHRRAVTAVVTGSAAPRPPTAAREPATVSVPRLYSRGFEAPPNPRLPQGSSDAGSLAPGYTASPLGARRMLRSSLAYVSARHSQSRCRVSVRARPSQRMQQGGFGLWHPWHRVNAPDFGHRPHSVCAQLTQRSGPHRRCYSLPHLTAARARCSPGIASLPSLRPQLALAHGRCSFARGAALARARSFGSFDRQRRAQSAAIDVTHQGRRSPSKPDRLPVPARCAASRSNGRRARGESESKWSSSPFIRAWPSLRRAAVVASPSESLRCCIDFPPPPARRVIILRLRHSAAVEDAAKGQNQTRPAHENTKPNPDRNSPDRNRTR